MDYSLNECGVCASESVVAFCENCNFRICKTCFQMHKKSTKLFQNHVAFLIENTQPTEDASFPVDHAREVSKESLDDIHTHKCATHTTENLVFFCTEHTETLCGRCVFSRHKSCKVVDLFEVNVDDEEVQSCKSHLQNLVENLKSNENKIEKNTNENNACKLEFLKDLQQLRTYVIAWCDRLLSKCDKQCNDTFKRNDERLTQVRTFCQEHIKRFQERQELIDNLLTQNHFKKLYVLINRIKKEIEQIQLNSNCPNSASTFNGYVFKRSSDIEELLNSRTFEIGGLEEWCSGSDELLDDTFSSLTPKKGGEPSQNSQTATGSADLERLQEEVTNQAYKVLDLKAKKAEKGVIDAEVNRLKVGILLELEQQLIKTQVPSATTETGGGKKKGEKGDQPAVKQEVKVTANNGTSSPAEVERLNKLVTEQANKVRDLKAKKAEKGVIDAEIKMLLELKKQLADAQVSSAVSETGGGKKKSKKGDQPAVKQEVKVTANNGPASPAEVERLNKLVTEQGNKVRDVKAAKAEKALVDAEVSKLLDLKRQLALAQGENADVSSTGGKQKGKKK